MFSSFNIEIIRLNELNSYRAKRIAAYSDKSIDKKHLSVFIKNANYFYKKINADIYFYIKELLFYIHNYVDDVLIEFHKTINNVQNLLLIIDLFSK